MYGRNNLLITSFILVLLLSGFGLFRLFALRFEKGDMFPPYSSLRSDPLGCKALFMALERMSGLEVERNFRETGKLKGVRGRTIYYLGAGNNLLEAASDKQASQLEALASEGNRLVIALLPGKGRDLVASPEQHSDDGDGTENRKQGSHVAQKNATDAASSSRAGRWRIETASFDAPAKLDSEYSQANLAAPVSMLPATIPLRSRHWLQTDCDEWRAVYVYDKQPFVLERSFGKGSIVLMADSYLLSNEAMRNDRQAGLLAWLQGTHQAALFDESHLGVFDNPGVMALVRKHHLLPFLAALMTLALLHLWKSVIPFATPPFPENDPRKEGGRDNFSGLVNLLRRNIVPADLLDSCYREWLKSFARESGQQPELGERIRAVMKRESAKPAQKRDPVAAYREISGILSNLRLR